MADLAPSREQSLASIPLFAAIDADLERSATPLDSGPWAQLAAGATSARVAAGDWLWREGDPGDSLYVVLTGRLEVVVANAGTGRVIRVLGRGDSVGELALLTGTARSAGVRAVRDSELLRVGRAEFVALLDSDPQFARGLARALADQLRVVRDTGIEVDPLPSTVAVVGLESGLPLRDVAGYLTLQLGMRRNVLALDGVHEGAASDDAAFGRALDRAEREHEVVLLVAADPDPHDSWTGFCLRQADRILAVAGGDRDGAVPRHERLRGCDLLVLESGTRANLDRLAAQLDPRQVAYAGDAGGRAGALERIARRLSGRAVGLVLSGGGARAFAHVGVLQEIERAGVVVDRVAGTSGGAYVGAQYALGRSPEEILAVCRREFVDDNPLDDYTLPLVSLTRNRKGLAMLDRTFGDARFEELEREFFCISCDMQTAKQVVHRRGRLATGVGASMTLPGVLPPFAAEGRLLLDGGVLNNLPVDVMAATGEGPIVAVDVSAQFELPVARPSRFRRPRVARAAERARRWVVGSDLPLPSFAETVIRSIVLGSADTTEAAERYADVVIVPDVADCSLLDWHRIDDLVERGAAATRRALERAPSSVLSR